MFALSLGSFGNSDCHEGGITKSSSRREVTIPKDMIPTAYHGEGV